MNYSLAMPSTCDMDLSLKPVFNVVLVYDDFDAGVHAKRFFDFLVRQYGQHLTLICHLWRTDILEVAALAETATREVGDAAMIVLAVRNAPAIPTAAKVWLAAVAHPHDDREIAWVALLPGTTTNSTGRAAIRLQLQQIVGQEFGRFVCFGFDESAEAPGLSNLTPRTRVEIEQFLEARFPVNLHWAAGRAASTSDPEAE